MRRTLSALLSAAWVATAVIALAQPARPAAVVSPQVLPDQRVTFRLRAPNAQEVTITGDFWLEQTRTAKLVKDDQGVWSITLGPFSPDIYSYAFNVDGTSMPDPANGVIKPGISTTQSVFTIPGEQAAFLEARPVPHGDVRIVYFQSAVAGGVRRMHLYFPPGYDTAQARYPVMYLLQLAVVPALLRRVRADGVSIGVEGETVEKMNLHDDKLVSLMPANAGGRGGAGRGGRG